MKVTKSVRRRSRNPAIADGQEAEVEGRKLEVSRQQAANSRQWAAGGVRAKASDGVPAGSALVDVERGVAGLYDLPALALVALQHGRANRRIALGLD